MSQDQLLGSNGVANMYPNSDFKGRDKSSAHSGSKGRNFFSGEGGLLIKHESQGSGYSSDNKLS